MSRNLIDRDGLIDALDNTIKSLVRDALEDKIASYHLTLTVPFAECFKEIINKIEPVDAVEVVRCKDCKYYDVNLADGTTCFCTRLELFNEHDWFCADGERKE